MQILKRATGPRMRAFTIVEVAIASGLFLVVSALIAWGLAAAYSAKHAAELERTSSGAVHAFLDDLADLPFDDLVNNNFTVPSPCPSTSGGFNGRSCVEVAGTYFEVAYQVTSEPNKNTECADSTDPAAVFAAVGHLPIKGCLVGVSDTSITGQEPPLNLFPARVRNVYPSGQTQAQRTAGVEPSGEVKVVENRDAVLVRNYEPGQTRATKAQNGRAEFKQLNSAEPAGGQRYACTHRTLCHIAVAPSDAELLNTVAKRNEAITPKEATVGT